MAKTSLSQHPQREITRRDVVGVTPGRPRWLLGFAGAAVLLAAADTYVVVTVLTSMMFDLGISIDHLQQATPIVSGFLVGYVAVLPLLGRLSDIHGRRPVFLACLVVFAIGSLVSAAATSLPMIVVGRTLQGLGGGGLYPVTLALVADHWKAEERGRPLGVIAGVQEFGAVIGPLYGAAVIALTSWRAIFWINLPIAMLFGIGIVRTFPRQRAESRSARDWIGIVLLLVVVIFGSAAIAAPDALTDNVVIGALYGPILGTSELLAPMALIAIAALVLFFIWESLNSGPIRLLNVRATPRVLREADWLGAVLLSAVLAMIVISFAAADPTQQIIASAALVLLPLAVACAVWFVIHENRAAHPLVRLAEFRDRAAISAIACNLFVGTGLVAALINVPIFARSTSDPYSQVAAAFVLLRMLIAVPIGAYLGGALTRRMSSRVLTISGMLMSGVAFVVMTSWGPTALDDRLFGIAALHPSDIALIVCGFGFGLVIAPVNAAILAAVAPAWHGLAASLVVVARSIGMLVGLALLTAIGLRQFNVLAARLPLPQALCPDTPTNCPAYDVLSRNAILGELHVIFAGAAIACALAAVVALGLRGRSPQSAQSEVAHA